MQKKSLFLLQIIHAATKAVKTHNAYTETYVSNLNVTATAFPSSQPQPWVPIGTHRLALCSDLQQILQSSFKGCYRENLSNIIRNSSNPWADMDFLLGPHVKTINILFIDTAFPGRSRSSVDSRTMGQVLRGWPNNPC